MGAAPAAAQEKVEEEVSLGDEKEENEKTKGDEQETITDEKEVAARLTGLIQMLELEEKDAKREWEDATDLLIRREVAISILKRKIVETDQQCAENLGCVLRANDDVHLRLGRSLFALARRRPPARVYGGHLLPAGAAKPVRDEDVAAFVEATGTAHKAWTLARADWPADAWGPFAQGNACALLAPRPLSPSARRG